MQPVWPLNRRFQGLSLRPGGRWVLESTDDESLQSHVQICFLGVTDGASEGALEIHEIRRLTAAAGASRYVIQTVIGPIPVIAHRLLVHETPGPGYRSVLPGEDVPWTQRWMWRVLLLGLRIPGVFALVSRLRRREVLHQSGR